VLNAAARLVYSRRTSEHTTPVLRELHCCVPERIQFRLCVLAYTVQHRRTCPTACDRHRRSSLVAVSVLLTPRHCRCRRLAGLALATAPFRWLQRRHEQSAIRDSGLLLTFDISEGDEVSPFSSFIRLTWRCSCRPSANVSVEQYNSF